MSVLVCRKCKQPLQIDPSLLRIDRALLRSGERSLEALVAQAPAVTVQPFQRSQSSVLLSSSVTSVSPPSESPSKRRPFGRPALSMRLSDNGKNGDAAMSLASSGRYGSNRHKMRESVREGGQSSNNKVDQTLSQLLGTSKDGTQLPIMNVSESVEHEKGHVKSSSSTMHMMRRSKRMTTAQKTSQTVRNPNESAAVSVVTPNTGRGVAVASSHGVTLSSSYLMGQTPSGLSQSVAAGTPKGVQTKQHQLAAVTATATSPSSASSGSSSGENRSRVLGSASQSPQSLPTAGGEEGDTNNEAEQRERERAAAELFAIVADLTSMDHPLCTYCAAKVMKDMQNELSMLESEAKKYEECGKTLEMTIKEEQNEQELLAETEALKKREAELREELGKTAQEKLRVQKERVVAEQRLHKLKELELKYWERFSYHQRKLLQQEEAVETLTVSLRYKRTRLEHLCKVNILNDAFYISHDGHFGTINDSRLGRMTSVPVSWDENNAALGYLALLVNTLAKTLNFQSQVFTIVPRGSNSRVIRRDPGSAYSTVLELFGESGRFMWSRHFDSAIVSFLGFVAELINHCQRIDPSFHPPHAIDNDTIGGISIRLSKDDYQWTRALKFLLTDVKWIVAWVSTRPRR